MTENGINNMKLKVFDESTKSMGVEDRKDMSRKNVKGEMKRDIFIISKLEVLGMRDSMEKLD